MRSDRSYRSVVSPQQAPAVFDPGVFLDQVEVLQQQFARAVFPSAVAAFLSACIIYKFSSDSACLYWLIVFAFITGLRIYHGLVRGREQESIVGASEWYSLFLLGCIMAGSMWSYLGIAVIAALEMGRLELAFLHSINVLFIAGLTAGALLSYRTSFLAFLVFSLPAVVPYGIYLAVQPDSYQPIPGILLLMYFLFLLMIGFNNRLNQPLSDRNSTGC